MSINEPIGPEDVPDEITETADSSIPDQLSKDNAFDLLKNRRRRKVLAFLSEVEGTVTLSDLAEEIAAWENNIEIRELNSAQRKRVYVGLYQTHLPRMADAGVIEYNRDRGLIALSENAELLQEYLAKVGERPDRWPKRFALVSGSGLIWSTGTYLSVPVLSTGLMILVSGIIIGGLLLVSLVYLFRAYQTQQTIDDPMPKVT